MKSPEVFYLHINGEQRGPYTIRHIDHLLNSGLINEEATFWREGMEEWQPVTNLVALRRKKKGWIRPAVAGITLVVVAIFMRIFGPITLDGWRESAQTQYSEAAAYWKARDYARHEANRISAAVQFFGENLASVRLVPPDGAIAVVRGKLIERGGAVRETSWQVKLRYDARRKEWTNEGVEELITRP